MSSRLLILALTVVAVAIGGVNLSLTAPDAVRAVHNQLDGQLARAAKELPRALEGSSAGSVGLAAAVARAPAIQQALAQAGRKAGAPDQALLDQVIGAADTAAEASGTRGVRNLVVVANGSGAAVFRVGEENEFATETGVPLIKDALAGSSASAVSTIGDAVFRLAAAPVAADGQPVGAVALGFPVDDAFAAALGEAIGADVTLLSEGRILGTTLDAGERGLLPAALAGIAPGETFGFGDLPQETFSLFGLVELPLFAESANAVRARSVQVPGLEGSQVVVSTRSAAALVPLADGQKSTVLFTGVILVVGLLFTGLARAKGAGYEAEEVEGLADVAERAASGDTGARAAEFLPGDLGRLARAINKLAVKAKTAAVVPPAAAGAEAAAADEAPADQLAEQFPFAGESAGPQAAAAPTPGPAKAAEHSAGPAAAFATSAVGGTAHSAGPAAAFETSAVGGAERSAGPAAAFETSAVGGAERSAGPRSEPTADVAARFAASLEAGRSNGPLGDAPAYLQPAASETPQQGGQTLGWGHANQVEAGSSVLGSEVPAPRNEDDLGALGDAPREEAPTAGPSDASAFARALEEAGGQQEPFNPDATVVAAVPEALLRATSRAAAPARPAAPAPVDPDQAHFQQVYRDFLATRERCNESVGGLTWEKFNAKLLKNRDQLVAKYGCRTVRFTVYVKDGKAALKASPVRG